MGHKVEVIIHACANSWTLIVRHEVAVCISQQHPKTLNSALRNVTHTQLKVV